MEHCPERGWQPGHAGGLGRCGRSSRGTARTSLSALGPFPPWDSAPAHGRALANPRIRPWIRGLGALALVVSLSGLGAGAAALDLLRGGDLRGARGPTLCSFRARTGLPCLGCGGTRALERMRQGDWRSALAANPLGAFVGVALWLLATGGAAAAATGRAIFVKAVLAVLAAFAPGAFVWNAVAWWLALPR